MLWLALSLPEFPLQSLLQADSRLPLAVYENRAGKALIYALNTRASQGGAEAGMSVGAAQALVNGLHCVERRIDREQAALERLARWAQQFTPVVSIVPGQGLLLEVAASLRLFGGIRALQYAVDEAIGPLGYTVQQAVAPTPGGAWLLALAGVAQVVTERSHLQSIVSALPVYLLGLSKDQSHTLRSSGIKTLGQCLQLPREGLTRRLGAPFVLQLDKILGRQPDSRKLYEVPEQFSSQIMLPDTVTHTDQLLFALQRLLHELCGFLRARNAGAQQLRVGLIAPRHPVTWLSLDLLAPGHDAGHLLKLWQEKLERHQLEEPVEGLELQVPLLIPLAQTNLDLFTPQQDDGQSFAQFLERLRNRLGNDAIQQICCHADHRPERAVTLQPYQANARAAKPAEALYPERPLWLLQTPQPLHCSERGPWLNGPLTILQGPERIESGWWDSQDQRRDYYLAENPDGQQLWIFQAVAADRGWYWHGLFG